MDVMKNIFVISLCCLANGLCGSMNDTKTLLKNLLANYDINVRPVADQSKPVNVTIQASIKSIQEFDEVQGKLSFVGALLVTWHDVNMMWNPALYGGIRETTVLYNNVWIPELILLSPAEDIDALGKKWNKIRYYADGTALWLPVDLIVTTCSVNVRNYPFDIQECETSFNSLGYHEYEVKLHPMTDTFDFSVYQENSIWQISESKIAVSETGGHSQINLVLFLDRKPSFVIINVILPILFLSLLNVVVFLLIPESGERVSYAITVLLSIAVFMTIVSDLLPRSSDPVPVISYKLMMDMVLSSLIVLVTIVNLKWYYKEDTEPVPARLQSVYHFLTCRCGISSQIDPKCDSETNMAPREGGAKKMEVKTVIVQECGSKNVDSPLVQHNNRETVTWRMFSKLIDRIALVSFTLASVVSFAVFMAVTAINSM